MRGKRYILRKKYIQYREIISRQEDRISEHRIKI